jgi:hypothetical protein
MAHPILTVNRANSILKDVSDRLASGTADYLDSYSEFKRAGAVSRLEAIHAINIYLADYYLSLTASERANSQAMKNFDDYVSASAGMALGVAYDPDLNNISPDVSSCESSDTFIEFVKSLDTNASSFWPQVFNRLGLEMPLPTINRKKWWEFWR